MQRTVLTSADPALALRLAASWQADGEAVTVVLLDAAAAVARPGHRDARGVAGAIASGVRVAAERDALGRRGLDAAGLAAGVEIVDLDDVADLVTTRGSRAVWL